MKKSVVMEDGGGEDEDTAISTTSRPKQPSTLAALHLPSAPEEDHLPPALNDALFALVVKRVVAAWKGVCQRPGMHPRAWAGACIPSSKEYREVVCGMLWVAVDALFHRKGLQSSAELQSRLSAASVRLRDSLVRVARVDFPLFLGGCVGDTVFLLLTFCVPAAQSTTLTPRGYRRVVDLCSLLIEGTLRLTPAFRLIAEEGRFVSDVVREERRKLDIGVDGVYARFDVRIPVFFPDDYTSIRRTRKRRTRKERKIGRKEKGEEEEEEEDGVRLREQELSGPSAAAVAREKSFATSESILRRLGFSITSTSVTHNPYYLEKSPKRSERRVGLSVSGFVHKTIHDANLHHPLPPSPPPSPPKIDHTQSRPLAHSLREICRRPQLPQRKESLQPQSTDLFLGEEDSTTFLTGIGYEESFVSEAQLPTPPTSPTQPPPLSPPPPPPSSLMVRGEDVTVGAGSVLFPPVASEKDLASISRIATMDHVPLKTRLKHASEEAKCFRRPLPRAPDPPRGLVNFFQTAPPAHDPRYEDEPPRSVLFGDLADPSWRAILDPALQGVLDDAEAERAAVEAQVAATETNIATWKLDEILAQELLHPGLAPVTDHLPDLEDDEDDDGGGGGDGDDGGSDKGGDKAEEGKGADDGGKASDEDVVRYAEVKKESKAPTLLEVVEAPRRALRAERRKAFRKISQHRKSTASDIAEVRKEQRALRKDPLTVSDFARQVAAEQAHKEAQERELMKQLAKFRIKS